mmetsp:Transcript_43090/g.69952  ORF Transcript_43090/g.69952 Transcript_43090/m.69952 type:complete len:96 (-) Transcript_43090:300-587(-)
MAQSLSQGMEPMCKEKPRSLFKALVLVRPNFSCSIWLDGVQATSSLYSTKLVQMDVTFSLARNGFRKADFSSHLNLNRRNGVWNVGETVLERNLP